MYCAHACIHRRGDVHARPRGSCALVRSSRRGFPRDRDRPTACTRAHATATCPSRICVSSEFMVPRYAARLAAINPHHARIRCSNVVQRCRCKIPEPRRQRVLIADSVLAQALRRASFDSPCIASRTPHVPPWKHTRAGSASHVTYACDGRATVVFLLRAIARVPCYRPRRSTALPRRRISVRPRLAFGSPRVGMRMIRCTRVLALNGARRAAPGESFDRYTNAIARKQSS